jgi:hypothetical protein
VQQDPDTKRGKGYSLYRHRDVCRMTIELDTKENVLEGRRPRAEWIVRNCAKYQQRGPQGAEQCKDQEVAVPSRFCVCRIVQRLPSSK